MWTFTTFELLVVIISGGVAAGLIVLAFIVAAEIYCDRQQARLEDKQLNNLN